VFVDLTYATLPVSAAIVGTVSGITVSSVLIPPLE